MSEHDLVIRGGLVVDGTGTPGSVADVAVRDGVVVAVAPRIDGRGHREIDADGLLVTPGFVDIHTHFDGQAAWDSLLAPSSVNGVTSVVLGNCGVGFAPAHRSDDEHEWLIRMMEGVEDIPGTALSEGLTWEWETFGEYLDTLAARRFSVDVGTQMPHAPLRAYVMGERGADPAEEPTDAELASMAEHVRAAVEAGALGFSTSRTVNHRTRDGDALGTRHSSGRELQALAGAMSAGGHGVVQLVSDAYLSTDGDHVASELAMLTELATSTGRPLSLSLQQPDAAPDRWREILAWIDACTADGLAIKAQVAPRPIGVLMGLTASLHPLMICPSFAALAGRPLTEIVGALARPEVRATLVAEHAEALRTDTAPLTTLMGTFGRLFPLGDPVDYEPSPSTSVAALARSQGRAPIEVVIDVLLGNGGTDLLYSPLFNYAHGNLDDVREMLLSPHTIIGLSDAGAHCGAVCDASFPTTALSLWSRDRATGQLPLELMVHHLTQRTARHVGWHDRGVLAPGLRADINVIDMATLGARPPRIAHDLPAGGRRLVQTAHGYRHTFTGGAETFTDGEHTGALPGRLVRGPQAAR
ncbi:amidohydrolase family protein [Pseudonocardia ailaonensis]|uniref:Amidohydrolase family protein n=1 Tax=Pseudonocardia ailaonensis TaxID=367279 RepID=A0ABN2N2A9_9PSEU